MSKQHHYQIQVEWTGNLGEGTKNYKTYSRNHEIAAAGKATISGSSDPAFRGDAARYNPEDLFVSTLASCHMLWYLHLCSANGLTVISYVDNAEGIMKEQADGSGAFEVVTLKPTIVLKEGDDVTLARSLHKEAHKMCFIANSVNFPVKCEPSILTEK